LNSSVSAIHSWFASREWHAFPFQVEAWDALLAGENGLVNAPTGSGKTYSLMAPILMEAAHQPASKGLRAIWITPIRALAKEIEVAAMRMINELNLPLTISIRTGDTHPAERQKQNRAMPHVLITTPETLHLLFTSKDHQQTFQHLTTLVVDEWHELLGSKRGVQIELATAYLRSFRSTLRVWGISATVGNMSEALEVLVQPQFAAKARIIRSDIQKVLTVHTLMPAEFERLPWAGHMGVKLIHQVIEVIHRHQSTLIFTNTRAQSEVWYQQLMEFAPELMGRVAMHHSAIAADVRNWVEDALYEGRLKAVVCTSSLDLGVDFRPVDAVIQIGGPKGVARFMQRAGRSGHRPGAPSQIYFLPTHALELIEAAALREAIENDRVENRLPFVNSFDVLIQFLTTLAVGGGFQEAQVWEAIHKTHAFQTMDRSAWIWCLQFITTGGRSLVAYEEYRKVIFENERYHIASQRAARRHRMSIGTIVGDTLVQVKYKRGARIGFVEEYFAASLNTGDVFWFAGRNLESLGLHELTLEVKNSTKKAGRTPAWQGGRLPLSSQLSDTLRSKIDDFVQGVVIDPEMEHIRPLLELQAKRSIIPDRNTFLVEYFRSNDGHHYFFYPFEGRLVHEGMASLFAWRIGQHLPISFSLAFNDYGFELLSDQAFDLEQMVEQGLFSANYLMPNLEASINAAEMARRRFRDIAVIAGLVFKGFPGEKVRDKHLQSSSSLIFDVFAEHDEHNLLLKQAESEVLEHQLEFGRFAEVVQRLNQQTYSFQILDKPSPLAFPLMVDRLRERLSTEKLEDRVLKMQRSYAE
jgi:ATP-dependent Lhr-like helicase